jgi:hypothetical protein
MILKRGVPTAVYRIAALVAAWIICLTLTARQAEVLAPHRTIARNILRPLHLGQNPSVQFMSGKQWMVDLNLKSFIYIKPLVETIAAKVTPIPSLRNGVLIALDDKKLEFVELRYTWLWNSVYVTVRDRDMDITRSLIYTLALQPSLLESPTKPNNTQQLFWRRS